MLRSFIKIGKDIAGSVIFWCAAVSIVASACHIAGDVTASFVKSRKAGEAEAVLSKSGTAEKAGSVPAGKQISEEAEFAAAGQDAGNRESGEDTAGSSLANGDLSAGSTRDDSSPEDDVSDGSASGSSKGSLSAEPLKKTVALTFDDGPHPVYTKKLLDGLLERDVKATFFVIGENIPGNEDLIARMEEEGHLIGNHTYDHVKICDMKKEDACYQVEQTSALVREITGHDTEFVRPPFGAWNPDLECSFVMIPVLWDVDPLDWTTSNTSLVVQRVTEEADDQDIILLHDFYESSVDAALQIIDILKKEGFEFVTVDKLILP